MITKWLLLDTFIREVTWGVFLSIGCTIHASGIISTRRTSMKKTSLPLLAVAIRTKALWDISSLTVSKDISIHSPY
jgi:hypothetical protein